MTERRRQLAVAAFVGAFLLNPVRWLVDGPGGTLEPRTDLQQAVGGILLALSLILVGVGIWLVKRRDS